MDNEAGLHLFTSNRLETLAAKLSERLRRPLPSPLQPEIIVVRNQGMERWLKLELARHHGICANTRFRFPEAFAYEMFRTVLPAMADDPPFEREVMLWKIMKTLPGLLSRREFGSLEQYLSRRADPRKLVQLASRIAHLFDQYLIFRPEMVLAWEEGRDEHWQAILWRSLARETNGRHPAALRRDFAAALAQPNVERSGLPERVSIFGLSAL
ncbi:MAG: exodeoxyribonuclease V subunit gamma, partial [Verrucomicrobia bacterium]